MKIAIFGASGQTGKAITKKALALGHHVIAYVRAPEKFMLTHENLEIIQADVLSLNSTKIESSLDQCMHVIIALGSKKLWGNTTRSIGTQNIISVLQKCPSKPKVWVISALGTGKSIRQLGWFNTFLTYALLYSVIKEHGKQEQIVKDSGLPFTIIHATGLVNKPESANYQIILEGKVNTSTIAREDLALAILNHLENQDYRNKTICVTSKPKGDK